MVGEGSDEDREALQVELANTLADQLGVPLRSVEEAVGVATGDWSVEIQCVRPVTDPHHRFAVHTPWEPGRYPASRWGRCRGMTDHEWWEPGDVVLARDGCLWCRAEQHDIDAGWPWAYNPSCVPLSGGCTPPEGSVEESYPVRPLVLVFRGGQLVGPSRDQLLGWALRVARLSYQVGDELAADAAIDLRLDIRRAADTQGRDRTSGKSS